MDIKTIAVIALSVVLILSIGAATIIAKAAFAENASELGKEESELILRVGTVAIVVFAGLYFAAFGLLSEAIPFLSPIAAFVLGGIKARK